jgi:hypothetical protein
MKKLRLGGVSSCSKKPAEAGLHQPSRDPRGLAPMKNMTTMHMMTKYVRQMMITFMPHSPR